MEILLFALIATIACFGLVVLVGAPYVPAHKKAVEDSLNLIEDDVKISKNGRILDLGCGDGKFLVEAAKKGYKVTGYEINVVLFLVCKLRLIKFRNAEVKLRNFWKADFPEDTEVVYVFLLDRFMARLDEKMKTEAGRLGSFGKLTSSLKLRSTSRMTKSGLSLVSYVFRIPGKEAVREVDGVRLYKY